MTVVNILIAAVVLGLMGLLFGLLLMGTEKVFAIPADEKRDAVRAALPGANCGACGFSGCSGYAAALSKGEAQPGLCSPGGEACAKACAELLGTGDVAVEKKTALVHCMGSYDCTSDKMRYDGIDSCAASTLLAGGISSCRYGCMGMGDCAAVCEYGAINVCNGMASIDPAKCRGCAKCTAACPKGLISFMPLKKQAVVRCSNCDKGAETMKVCKVGCIGCGKCEKACRSGALKLEDMPDGQTRVVITPWKCSECGVCVAACSNSGIDGMKLRQLTTLGPVSVYKCSKTLCADCGKPIAPNSSEGICSVCRIKRRTKQRQEEAAARAKERIAEREARKAAEEAAKAAAAELAAENAANASGAAAAETAAVPVSAAPAAAAATVVSVAETASAPEKD